MIHVNFQKRIVALAIMLIATSVTMTVASRSVEQARKEAQKLRLKNGFLKAKDGTEYSVPQLVFSKDNGKVKAHENNSFYVFSNGFDKGYTIISKNENNPAVIGYSETGNYDENIKKLLSTCNTNNTVKRTRSTGRQNIEPFLDKQICAADAYFWRSPMYVAENGYEIPTGMNSFMALVLKMMYYYRWPDMLKEDIPGYNTKDINVGYETKYNFVIDPIKKGFVYDWETMHSTPTTREEEIKRFYAISDLSYHIECAHKFKFSEDCGNYCGPIGMSFMETDRDAIKIDTLVKYFAIDKDCRYVSRDGYTIEQWDNLIYNEISHGRPVYCESCSLSDKDRTILNDYVIDGYKDGLYHMYGCSDYGYFDLGFLNMVNETMPSYNFSIRAIIGFQPENNVVDEDVYNQPRINSLKYVQFIDKNIDTNTKTISGTVRTAVNNYFMEDYVYIGIGLIDEEGNVIKNICDNTEKIDYNTLPKGEFIEKRFNISFNYEDNIRYKLCLIESNDNVNWVPSISRFINTSLYVTVENGEIITSEHEPKLTVTIKHDETFIDNWSKQNNFPYGEWQKKYDVTFKNESPDEYNGLIFICINNTDVHPEIPEYIYNAYIPGNDSYTINLYNHNYEPGTYYYWIYDAIDIFSANKLIGQGTFTIAEPENSTGIENVDTPENDNVSVYDMSGMNVYNGNKHNMHLKPGVYIVKNGNSTQKVVVR